MALDQPVMIALTIMFFACGMAAGAIHFLSLRKDADLLVAGGPMLRALGLRLGRLMMTIGILAGTATQGAPALLAAAGGFLLARSLVLNRMRYVS